MRTETCKTERHNLHRELGVITFKKLQFIKEYRVKLCHFLIVEVNLNSFNHTWTVTCDGEGQRHLGYSHCKMVNLPV